MQSLDLNLLIALDALLAEGSVTRAAAKVGLSTPAMSRALGRIRSALGDPILARAGRRLVPTPRALALRPRVRALVAEAQALLRPEREISPELLERTFTIRASEVFAGAFAAEILRAVRAEAPRVVLRFAPEGEEDVEPLRDGRIDLDVGAIGQTGPEVKVQALYRDRFVGAVRRGHPLMRGEVTPSRFAAHGHISASRRGRARGPIDDALRGIGLEREVALVVPGFYSALAAAAGSDLVASVPGSLAGLAEASFRVRTFPLPLAVDPVEVSLAWHPRFDADPAHRWLRGVVRSACAGMAGGDRSEG